MVFLQLMVIIGILTIFFGIFSSKLDDDIKELKSQYEIIINILQEKEK